MLKSERTQERILEAARSAFAERGFHATSLRTIATGAGVDPSLCIHYFGSKQELFLAATELPVDLRSVLASEGSGEEVGERMARAFATVLDDDAARASLVALVRSAASDPRAAELVRELVGTRVVLPALANLAVDRPALRATLAGSQLIGLVFSRHIVGLAPLVETDTGTLVAAVAPTLQRYLTEPLP